MPVYEYVCRKCKEDFTEILTVQEMEKGGVKCPHCGSDKVTKIISHIHTITKKKS